MLNSKDNSVSFFLRSLFLFVFSFALISCGSSSGDDDGDSGNNTGADGNTGSGSGSDAASIAPVVPLTSKAVQDVPFLVGVQATFESGFEGNIEVVTAQNNDSVPSTSALKLLVDDSSSGNISFVTQKFQLANGIPSMNVVDVQRTNAIELSCDDGTNINGVMSSGFSSGKVDRSATANGRSLSCSSNFNPAVTATITDDQSIRKLLEQWGTDDDSNSASVTGLIDTTCPQGDGDDFDVNPFKKACNGSILSNYIVTDDNGGVHNISIKITFSSTGGTTPPIIPPNIPLPPTPQAAPPETPVIPLPPGSNPPTIPVPPGGLPPIPPSGGFPTDGFLPDGSIPDGFLPDGFPTPPST